MHKSERQDEILAILKKNKYASVQDLGAALYASQPSGATLPVWKRQAMSCGVTAA